MSKTLRVVTVLMLIMLLVSVLPVTSIAQDEDDDIEYIVESINSIAEQYTFTWTFENLIIIDSNADSTWTERYAGDGFVMLKDGVVSAISLNLETEINIQGPGIALMDNLSFNVELIYIDDTLYVDFENATGIYAELLEDIVANGWVNVSELSSELGAYVISLIDLEALITQSFGDTDSFYQTEYITEIVELGNNTLNEQAMNGFTVNIDMQTVFASDAGVAALSGSGDELEELVNSSILETTLWIDEVDGLPYIVERVLMVEAEMDSITSTLISTQYTQYGDYNEPITIEAPEID